jgi:uncharacterized protein (DUF2249 family)
MESNAAAVEIDARLIPGPQRHAQIFAAFAALPAGQALELITDHEPRPLRAEFIAQWGNQHDWQTLEQGPAQWRSRITRLAARGCCGSCGGGGH